MNIVKYITSLFEFRETKKVECAKVWMVSWDARYGSYYGNWERVSKAFLNRDDAYAFAKSLKDAKKLLQITEGLRIEVEEQKC
jgi:membrane protein required for beta-lactamase induction